jgi:formiminotetrahydrofolate cyclodeaminase/Zn-dependent peptidase ImmA (M78 family)
MAINLLDLATRTLLKKFGQGSHKPGSGSAAALSALLSAELLRTVIDLTNKNKRAKDYGDVRQQLLEIKNEIDLRIYVELEKLFLEDSVEFDNVIQIRKERDNTNDPLKKAELNISARAAIRPAIEIPLRIADLTIELAQHATYVFDKGFRSARGDSSVALNNAISTIADCLSIVELNLKSCSFDDWIEEVRKRKRLIRNNYEKLLIISNERLKVLEREADESYEFQKSVDEFRRGNLGKSIKSDKDLEVMVRRLQNKIWSKRKHIWKNNEDLDALAILKPDVVLRKVFGYTYIESDHLGYVKAGDGLVEVAGLIDKKRMLVQSQRGLNQKILNFTLAHELGHAILHNQVIMHRDRPLDGSLNTPRTPVEAQADKFAAYFLMPGTLVREVFEAMFYTHKFMINSETALGLAKPVGDLLDSCNTLRDLTRLLARTEYYAGRPFKSLSDIFCVSEEAMAIRLEELGLAHFEQKRRLRNA